MRQSFVLASLVTAAAAGALSLSAVEGQNASPLAGVWTLNPSVSELPREIGFNVDWLPSSSAGQGGVVPSGAGPSGAGRGRRGSGGGAINRGSPDVFSAPLESYEDAQRVQLLIGEARNPPVRLMVVDTPAAVTITNELGQSRSLHPNGKEESVEIQGVPIPVTTKRDGDRLVVAYRAQKDREVRYTYSHSDSPPQLIVEVQFLEHGSGDKARRVYEPGVGTEAPASPATPTPAAPPGPSTGPKTPGTFDARPGAELRGLKSLGILVEDLSTQAVACGLNRDTIEAALSKRLTDGGLSVRRNSDDDSYVYVNVMTTTLSNGTCVSRYDAFLYTHATANLSYRDQPVLVQVSLMHRGGIGSSAPTAHPPAVVRGLENYIDLFVAQIHEANR
jgi:hypothetical protein